MTSALGLRVKVELTQEEVELLKKALAYHCVPVGWRPAEYAMTKESASTSLIDILADKETNLFALQCLIGELARFAVSRDKPKSDVACFLRLTSFVEASPEAAAYLNLVRQAEQQKSHAEQLFREAEQLQTAAIELQQSATVLRNTAINGFHALPEFNPDDWEFEADASSVYYRNRKTGNRLTVSQYRARVANVSS